MRSKTKVVFDTNIYISAIIFGGNPRTCLELARRREIEVYTSKAILFELTRKLKIKFRWQDKDLVDVVAGIGVFATVVEPTVKLTIIKNDPSDNKILECAKMADAKYIVSGDKKHILSLKSYENIKIVGAKEFLDTFYKAGNI